MSIFAALVLTTLAGLSTGIGSLLALIVKKTNVKFMSASLGFSAGVMIYVSMIELFDQARDSLRAILGAKMGMIATVLGFFGGMLLIAIIDRLIPQASNPHEIQSTGETNTAGQKQKMMRTGLFTALAIAIHNFPEGIAAFVAAQREPTLAIPVVVAIAIHNIPEGMAVALPIYYATGDRKKAFVYSFASGLAEPLAAVLAILFLMPFMNEVVNSILFAVVAGIMVFISLDELLPAAHEYGEHHLSIYGMVAGMAVMALSLLLFS